MLWQNHRQQVVVETPSFKTQGQWQLTAQGWIGFLPLERNLIFSLQPKVPLTNLFGMLAYAYGLDEIPFGEQLVDVESLDGYVDRLAYYLAKSIRRQIGAGLYQSYAEAVATLPYIRGQMDLNSLLTSLPGVDVLCRYDELTVDLLENQILVWTLHLLATSRVCSAETQRECQRLLSDFRKPVTLQPMGLHDCDKVTFHGLNHDYKPLIALCRFFLSHCEPGHLSSHQSDQPMLPFLINSASLFERFVAAWLKEHLHSDLRLHVQERRSIGVHSSLHFAIDLTIYNRATGVAKYAMDTKYKLPASTPDTADIAQVVAYAEAIGAPEAVLIYPAALDHPLDEQIGRIRVRSLAFDLVGGLMKSGQAFLTSLLN